MPRRRRWGHRLKAPEMDPIEAALCGDGSEDDPMHPGHPLRERWDRQDALPPLGRVAVGAMLSMPCADWSRDEMFRLRRELEKAGRLDDYSEFIGARMEAKL